MTNSKSIHKRDKKDRAGNVTGTVWRAKYRDPAGKEHARHFARKVDAQRWLDEATAAIVTGQYVDPKAGRITFREYAEAWRARQIHRPSSVAHVETMLRLHAYQAFGDVPLAEIQLQTIQMWVRRMTETLAPATVRVAHGIVSGIFNDAIANRRLVANPCAYTKLPDKPERKVVILTTDAVAGIHEHITDPYKALIHLAAATGMRQAEVFGLTVDRVNFLRREVTVDRQMIQVAGQGHRFGPPKRKASHRVIPVPQELVDALAAHVATFGTGDDGLLFTASYDRGPVRKSTFNAGPWRAAVRASSAPDEATFHWLRHYYASLLIRHGESVKTVQARLGHATAAETLDTYSHLWPDSDDRTRQAAAAALIVSATVPAGDYAGTTRS